MDEMILSNRKYVTTKRAARVTGYAQDYIGQLIRSGKLKATKVGKSWFVAEDEVLKLAGKPEAIQGPDRALAVLESRKVVQSLVSVSVEYPKTWAPIQYFNDDKPLAPISDKRETIENKSSIEILDVHRVRIAKQTSAQVNQGPVRYASFDGVSFVTTSHTTSQRPGTASGNAHETYQDDSMQGVETVALVPNIVPRHSDRRGVLMWLMRVLTSAVAVSFLVLLVPIIS